MEQEKIILNGQDLTIEDVARIAKDTIKVEISTEAMKRMEEARKFVFELADKGIPIYGFTTGVGVNKDKRVFEAYFEQYNRNLIYAHCVAVEPEATEENVRAIILARLNTFLVGRTGIQPAVAVMYKEFLNHGIHPVIPERGSVGQADISCLSHIGLAVMGEGEVDYNGTRMSAGEAMKIAGLKPVVLGPKDGLAIVSSSAHSSGPGALVLHEIKELVETANIVYALSLEGFDGNVTPLDEKVNEIRKMPGQIHCASQVRKYLEGSYLNKKSITKSVQDPLSYRDACAVHGAVLDSLDHVWKYLTIQLNTSDDNPCVLPEQDRIISCQNFEVTNWAVGFEMLGIVLSHLSKVCSHRTMRMAEPVFTKLSRFLTPSEGDILGFSTVQKTFTSIDTEIRHLSNPATADYFSISLDMEDHANNTPFVVKKTGQIVDLLRYIIGIEAMHGAQAVDLREDISLGKGTKAAYDVIRAGIPFYDTDRVLTTDFKTAYEIVKSGSILDAVRKSVN